MGAKIRVREGESISQAMRRLKNHIEMGNRYPLFRAKPTKKRLHEFQKPCEVNHQRRSLAKTRQQLNMNYRRKEMDRGFDPYIPLPSA